MASDYEQIRRENITRYGIDIGRIGRMLLADRYEERTHFIFELLQNTEDALARRQSSPRSRAVSFDLNETALRVSHYGDPFNHYDVVGICGIDESTKEVNEIGRFGIGFKSVYAFTDLPEVHSGTEDFAIEEYVRPIAVRAIDRRVDQTVILIPFKTSIHSAYDEIHTSLQRLGASGLLFLHHIDEVSWCAIGGASGHYLRKSRELDTNVRRVTIIGKQEGTATSDEEWLIFSRPVDFGDGNQTRPVEIAFSCVKDNESSTQRIVRVDQSPLVVFFPTAVETHLGFLVQGPYRTTPSRDNIPRADEWNKSLVQHTAALLIDSLVWLRDRHMLDTEVLRCLPLEQGKFDDGAMLAPLFHDTKAVLSSEQLLPRYDNGYSAAPDTRLGRSRELRDLFSPTHLTALYGHKRELSWLTSSITQNRTPELREYLMKELGVPEITPDDIIRGLNCAFLEAQPDDWIQRLYEFLNGQTALRRALSSIPLIRLENGKHVPPRTNNELSAFLPTETATEFPIVRASVCASRIAREFLESLGLKEPDPVDDVIANVLPKYQSEQMGDINDREYETDISRIVAAIGTDSQTQRKRLVNALAKTKFVRSIDAKNDSRHYAEPPRTYIATKRLKDLLNGVNDVLFFDDSNACLRGEEIRSVLEASGATRYLQPIPAQTTFSDTQRESMRIDAGCVDCTGGESIEDSTLRGLEELLAFLPTLDPAEQKTRAQLLWQALDELENRRGKGTFSGTYHWFFYRSRSVPFDATFVQRLNDARWVPDTNGNLHRPEFVPFPSLGWKEHPFLQSVIRFKPPDLDIIARRLGIEPGMIELLKEAGIETEYQLRERLGLGAKPADAPQPDHGQEHTEWETDSETSHPDASGWEHDSEDGNRNGETGTTSRPASGNARTFISYVAVHAEDKESDPDGLTNTRRMELEERAISFILKCEPEWQRTPRNNPGYDLFRTSERDEQVICEVKAMTGTLQDRPVGMTHTQFEYARQHGESFWLYVVERADDYEKTRIVRIQDPASRALTFTFDRGWLAMDAHSYFKRHNDNSD